jgi:regulator of RNase E activity RraA
MSLSPEALATLSHVSTATITTVLLKKGLRNIWMRGTKPLRPGQPRLVGPAFTLRFVPAREDLATPESWSSPISTRTAIEAMPKAASPWWMPWAKPTRASSATFSARAW